MPRVREWDEDERAGHEPIRSRDAGLIRKPKQRAHRAALRSLGRRVFAPFRIYVPDDDPYVIDRLAAMSHRRRTPNASA